MTKYRFALRALALVVFALSATSFVNAQASRTWVSGVGDDANPCSRTAPCKTFAGAISKTATNGEISVLDPGGFGALTITKSITIDGSNGAGFGSILAAGSNGIIVNAAGATVTLRRLSINGFATGTRGVNIFAAGTVNIEDCQIFNFVNEGILVNLTATGANINVRGCTLKNNGSAGGANGAGLKATTTATGSGVGSTIFLTVSNTSSDNNTEGFRIENNVRATIVNSTAFNNSLNGFTCFPGAQPSDLNLESCTSSNNKQWGVTAFSNGTIRMSNVTVTNNLVQGLNPSGTGAILTYSNNKVQGNGPTGTTNGSTTGTAPQG